jgi:hypothetical protein
VRTGASIMVLSLTNGDTAVCALYGALSAGMQQRSQS